MVWGRVKAGRTCPCLCVRMRVCPCACACVCMCAVNAHCIRGERHPATSRGHKQPTRAYASLGIEIANPRPLCSNLQSAG